MPQIFKLKGKTTELKNCLRKQIDYFNIQERSIGLDSRCWIKLGYCMASDIIAKNNGQLRYDNSWIDFIGFSRIDGEPIFNVPDDTFFNHEAKQIFSILTNDDMGGPYATYLHYFPVVNRKFSEMDPYVKKIGRIEMKHRVKEKNGKFYPQEREFLFWDNFVEPDKNIYPTEDVSMRVEYNEVFFYTLKEAQDYIERRKKDLESNKAKYYYDENKV